MAKEEKESVVTNEWCGQREKKTMVVINKWCGQRGKRVVQRWVFNHKVINQRNVWMSKNILFGPMRQEL